MIYVCSNCLRATCWLGLFMCDGSRGAGLYRARRSDLRKLDLENEDYWNEPSAVAPRHDTKTPMLPRDRKAGASCSDCPPVGYPHDRTRCAECPRSAGGAM